MYKLLKTKIMDGNTIVCRCFRKSLGEIVDTVNDKKCKTVEDIAKEIKAGTECGGCIGFLNHIIDVENNKK